MKAVDSSVPMHLLRVASQVAESVQEGLVERGFDDVRPSHAFAFARLRDGGATVVELAAHLGITKQAASQLVEALVQRGYVTRELNPSDGRAWALGLTDRGVACEQAAAAATADVVKRWRRQLDRSTWAGLDAALAALDAPGPVRHRW